MPPTPLNPEQRKAVNHMEGPLLVLAGPGSGKTRVVTSRIARLIKRGVDPSNILAVTFTNKAAREMRARVRLQTQKGATKGLTVSTFHAACARILRLEIEALGYGTNFSIYDQGNQQSLMRSILRDMGGDGSTRSAGAVLASLSDANNQSDAPGPAGGFDSTIDDDGMADPEAAFVAAASARYREELVARNAVDFDDLILLTARLFREHPAVLARWRDRFRFILVDEYQDTNRAQESILALLAGEHRNLCVVGDDDQSIYGWRGAELDLILTFDRRHQGTQVVRLEQNYRSTAPIVGAAMGIIRNNPARHKKELFTRRGTGSPVRVVELDNDTEEAEFIASEIARDVRRSDDKPWKAASRFAVLFRTNEQMRPLEQALRQANLPYRLLGGRSFFDRKEVVDVLAYLRLAANKSDDEALLRAINTPARGLGAKALLTLRSAARATKSDLWSAVASCADGSTTLDGMPQRAPIALAQLVRVMHDLESAAVARSPSLVDDLLARIDYQDEVDRTYKDGNVRQARMALAREVNASWKSYLDEAADPSLESFLDSIALRGNDDKDDDDDAGVTLATVHASKGLEFPEVFIAGLEEGFFPHKRSVDDGRELAEERRVLFVAVTRAKDRLTLTRAANRTLRGQTSPTVPSRFLDELPDGETEPVDPHAPASTEAASDNLARMRALLFD